MSDEEGVSSEERAQTALFDAVAGLAPHANPAELLTLAEVYDRVVGKDEPEADEKPIHSTESSQMLELGGFDSYDNRDPRRNLGFTPRT